MLAAPATPELRQFLGRAVAHARRQDGISRTGAALAGPRPAAQASACAACPYRGMPRSINRRPPCNTATPASPPSAWPAPRSPPRCPWPGRRRQRRSVAGHPGRQEAARGYRPGRAALRHEGRRAQVHRLGRRDRAAAGAGSGRELEIVPTTGANRVPFLQTNKADIVISSMSITPERQKVVDSRCPMPPSWRWWARPGP